MTVKIALYILFSLPIVLKSQERFETVLSQDDVYVEIHFKDFTDNLLIREKVHIINLSYGFQRVFTTNAEGKISFIAQIGTSFNLSFKYDLKSAGQKKKKQKTPIKLMLEGLSDSEYFHLIR